MALLAALLLLGCGGEASVAPARKVDRFDGRRAYDLAALQVSYGQRPAGSAQLRKLAEVLRRRLPAGRFENVPGHPGLRNIVGRLGPRVGKPIVLAAHYDTKDTPPGFVGANDAAAGTAVVVEVARVLRRSTLERPVRFVLFDGEEEPSPEDDFLRDAIRGSKAYAKAHSREIRELVLLDFVGNKGLRLRREDSSDSDLWERIRAAAQRVGVGRLFPDETGPAISDDHTPFLRAGVPAVDLIHWPYDYWHEVGDTLDKLSVASLDGVGETMVELLRQ